MGVVLLACGGRPTAPAPAPRPVDTGSVVQSGLDAGREGDDLPSLDELSARAAGEFSRMHEVSRVANVASGPTLTPTADTCYRAALVASGAVQAWFEDATHEPRGEVAAAAKGLRLVPPRGPVCARRGETLRLVVAPATTTLSARAVIWQAP